MAEQEELSPLLIGAGIIAAAGVGAVVVLLSQPAAAQVPTFLTVAVNPTNVALNTPVAVTGQLTRSDQGTGLPSQSIVVEVSADQVNWQTVTTTQTANDGTYTASVSFSAAGTYYIRTRFAGA